MQSAENIWTHETSNEVTAVAPAGTILIIEQVVGICGPNTVRTETVRISHKGKGDLRNCNPIDSFDTILDCDASDSEVIKMSNNCDKTLVIRRSKVSYG